MDCYTKPRCPGCQTAPQGHQCRPDVPMGPGPVIRPDLPLGSGPAVCPEMAAKPYPAARSDMGMNPDMAMRRGGAVCPGMGMCPDMPGPGPVIRPDMRRQPEMPLPNRPMMPSCSIDQFPVAMAYVPWQRWQQLYPLDKALCRGTIFPDLDLTFDMGRCR